MLPAHRTPSSASSGPELHPRSRVLPRSRRCSVFGPGACMALHRIRGALPLSVLTSTLATVPLPAKCTANGPLLPRTSVVAQAVKATEIKDYSDLATGHKVNPERRASQEFDVREMLQACTDWRACAALLEEQPERFERHKSLAYHLLARVTALVAPTLKAQAAGSALPPGASAIGPAERQAVKALAIKALGLASANLDKLRSEEVCGLVQSMALLQVPQLTVIKGVLLYMKSFTKRFTVSQLSGLLASCTQLNYPIPTSVHTVIMEQATRGIKYATAADCAALAENLQSLPRGAVPAEQLTAWVQRLQRQRLVWELPGPGLVHWLVTLDKQGVAPPRYFLPNALEALEPHLQQMKWVLGGGDGRLLLGLVAALKGLMGQVPQHILQQALATLTTPAAMAKLSAQDLGSLGSLLQLVSQPVSPLTGLVPGYSTEQQLSPETMAGFVAAVQGRLKEVDESLALALLHDLAWLLGWRPDCPVPVPVAPLPAWLDQAPPLGPVVSELLSIAEILVPSLPPASLASLTTSLAYLAPALPATQRLDPALASAIKSAVGSSVESAPSHLALLQLLQVVTQPQLPQLHLPAPTAAPTATPAAQAASKRGSVLAAAIKAAIVKATAGSEQTPSAAAAGKAGKAGGEMAAAVAMRHGPALAQAVASRARALTEPPSQEELQGLRDALGRLPGVDVAAALPPPPAYNETSFDSNQTFDANSSWSGNGQFDRSYDERNASYDGDSQWRQGALQAPRSQNARGTSARNTQRDWRDDGFNELNLADSTAPTTPTGTETWWGAEGPGHVGTAGEEMQSAWGGGRSFGSGTQPPRKRAGASSWAGSAAINDSYGEAQDEALGEFAGEDQGFGQAGRGVQRSQPWQQQQQQQPPRPAAGRGRGADPSFDSPNYDTQYDTQYDTYNTFLPPPQQQQQQPRDMRPARQQRQPQQRYDRGRGYGAGGERGWEDWEGDMGPQGGWNPGGNQGSGSGGDWLPSPPAAAAGAAPGNTWQGQGGGYEGQGQGGGYEGQGQGQGGPYGGQGQAQQAWDTPQYDPYSSSRSSNAAALDPYGSDQASGGHYAAPASQASGRQQTSGGDGWAYPEYAAISQDPYRSNQRQRSRGDGWADPGYAAISQDPYRSDQRQTSRGDEWDDPGYGRTGNRSSRDQRRAAGPGASSYDQRGAYGGMGAGPQLEDDDFGIKELAPEELSLLGLVPNAQQQPLGSGSFATPAPLQGVAKVSRFGDLLAGFEDELAAKAPQRQQAVPAYEFEEEDGGLGEFLDDQQAGYGDEEWAGGSQEYGSSGDGAAIGQDEYGRAAEESAGQASEESHIASQMHPGYGEQVNPQDAGLVSEAASAAVSENGETAVPPAKTKKKRQPKVAADASPEPAGQSAAADAADEGAAADAAGEGAVVKKRVRRKPVVTDVA
ncbi:hypothetical protein QJQ45_029787 [Haematococcus lacustris]|nr:hypothetical protein QJQ45_029787 [Haematococcus lacustris]